LPTVWGAADGMTSGGKAPARRSGWEGVSGGGRDIRGVIAAAVITMWIGRVATRVGWAEEGS